MNDSAPIDTHAIVEKCGTDPTDYGKVIPMFDRVMNGLRVGEYVILRSRIEVGSETVMWLEDRNDGGPCGRQKCRQGLRSSPTMEGRSDLPPKKWTGLSSF
jgi:hypothetical protein